jgi:hypothetical protein
MYLVFDLLESFLSDFVLRGEVQRGRIEGVDVLQEVGAAIRCCRAIVVGLEEQERLVVRASTGAKQSKTANAPQWVGRRGFLVVDGAASRRSAGLLPEASGGVWPADLRALTNAQLASFQSPPGAWTPRRAAFVRPPPELSGILLRGLAFPS